MLEVAAGGEWFAPVEEANVIHPQETAREKVVAFPILSVHPPGEVEREFLERSFEKGDIALAPRGRHLINAPCGPGVNRRVNIGQSPFVGGELTVRVHVPFAEKEPELAFGEDGIDFCEGDHVEGKVPCGEPWIFPFVTDREHIAGKDMLPIGVASLFAFWGRGRLAGIAEEPVADDVMVKLFGPDETGVGLSGDALGILFPMLRNFIPVKKVGFLLALLPQPLKFVSQVGGLIGFGVEPKPEFPAFAGL